jgi:hypothetical protein
MTHQHLRVHHTTSNDTASLLIIQLIAYHNLSAHHTAQPALNELFICCEITGVSDNFTPVLRRPRVSILGAQPPARISGVWCQARNVAGAKHSVPGDRRSSARSRRQAASEAWHGHANDCIRRAGLPREPRRARRMCARTRRWVFPSLRGPVVLRFPRHMWLSRCFLSTFANSLFRCALGIKASPLHTHTHTHPHPSTHPPTRARAHTHTHTHTHTQ